MRLLVISDIHANLAAFNAVLKHSAREWDRILCLGDVVGYGPDPNECTELAAELCTVMLGGNHDLAAAGIMGIEAFSPHARNAIIWTQSTLYARNSTFLSQCTPQAEYGDMLLSHGGPEDPIWSYIFSESDAEAAFAGADFTRCLFGHTHIPSAFMAPVGAIPQSGAGFACSVQYGNPDRIIETKTEGLRLLLNPGSVGFPRNSGEFHRLENLSHASAQYALFDTDTGRWRFKRTEYDMRDTAERMARLGL
ncbi:MAG: metallophosphatase family protein [Treponema sp.]|jgi:predicted phosphodiesterase|nr:metallophosphatase family protein [Treponema sp.]